MTWRGRLVRLLLPGVVLIGVQAGGQAFYGVDLEDRVEARQAAEAPRPPRPR